MYPISSGNAGQLSAKSSDLATTRRLTFIIGWVVRHGAARCRLGSAEGSMIHRTALFVGCLTLLATGQAVSQPTGGPAGPATHVLKATPRTVAWGHYDAKTSPVLRIKPGDAVEVHTLITSSPARLERAGVEPDKVEPALRDIHEQVNRQGPGRPHPDRADLRRRGRARRRPGGPDRIGQAGDPLRLQRLRAAERGDPGRLPPLQDADHPARRGEEESPASPRGSRSRSARSSAAWASPRRRPRAG